MHKRYLQLSNEQLEDIDKKEFDTFDSSINAHVHIIRPKYELLSLSIRNLKDTHMSAIAKQDWKHVMDIENELNIKLLQRIAGVHVSIEDDPQITVIKKTKAKVSKDSKTKEKSSRKSKSTPKQKDKTTSKHKTTKTSKSPK